MHSRSFCFARCIRFFATVLRNLQFFGNLNSGELITKSHFQRPAGALCQNLQTISQMIDRLASVVLTLV